MYSQESQRKLVILPQNPKQERASHSPTSRKPITTPGGDVHPETLNCEAGARLRAMRPIDRTSHCHRFSAKTRAWSSRTPITVSPSTLLSPFGLATYRGGGSLHGGFVYSALLVAGGSGPENVANANPPRLPYLHLWRIEMIMSVNIDTDLPQCPQWSQEELHWTGLARMPRTRPPPLTSSSPAGREPKARAVFEELQELGGLVPADVWVACSSADGFPNAPSMSARSCSKFKTSA
ncbi:hypothetical protein DFH06DRAFT_1146139 [Mycena polygramma]|nr:hypothetical protein DFH06DRAFT_1146139 [Mycena polygramma]